MPGSRWRRVLREPLVHFAVLGAALFGLYAVVGSEDPGSKQIVVGPGTLENIAATFQQTWQRPPTREELEGLVAEHVRDEILAREAKALGLDQGDVIVRRRLRQKMELLAASFGEAAEPSEVQLEDWLREHADRYRVEPKLSFTHIYLSRDRRGDAVAGDAARMLEDLRAGRSDPGTLGDPLLLPAELRDAPLSDVSRQFGEAFASRVAEIAPGAWTGPVESGYGVHLVRVDARVEGRLPALDEARDAVLRDWQSSQADAAREAHYRSLREGYTVVIEGLDAAQSPTAAAKPAR